VLYDALILPPTNHLANGTSHSRVFVHWSNHESFFASSSQNEIWFKFDTLLVSVSKFSKPIAKLKKGRLLLITKCKYNWCRVKTDNYKGWIENKEVWGSLK